MRRVRRAKDAADHADRLDPRWTEEAVHRLAVFAFAGNRRPFTVEMARAYVESSGFAAPPDRRAWGHIAREAQRRGLIRRVGYGMASDGSPKSLWVAA